MRYGSFDDDRREYVITRPDTPLPWVNYLGTEDYFGIISNTSGGYAFYRDARLRRLTRYRYNNAPLDLGGRYLYLRDDRTGDYWSPSWQPVQRDLEEYSCRHGLGYTVIGSSRGGIRVDTLTFVPLGEQLEVWRTTVTNERSEPARLSLFSSVEFCLWDAQDDASNFQRNYSVGEVEVVDGVIYHKSEYRERRDHFAYFACSEPLAGFDTQRDAFLGPYRGWDRPIVVERGASADSIAHGWQPMGSHHVRLELAPGESREVVFVLGYAENPIAEKFDPPGSQTIDKRRVRPVIERWLDPGRVAAALDDLRAYWTDLLGNLQVRTGSEHLDRMVNIWNAYQNMVTFNLSRSASMYESGIGRGIGFRDSNQDLLGFVHMIPGRARERLLDTASTQLPTGGAYHQYQTVHEARQRRRGFRLQRRPALARPRGGRLSQGDRRRDDPRRVRAVRQRARDRDAAVRAPPAGHRLHDRPARSARTPAHRPRRLERLSEPQLLLGHARRILPDDREPRRRRGGIRVHRRAVRPRRRGDGGHRGPAWRRRRARTMPDDERAAGRGGRRARLGRGVVPARLRLLRAASSARRRNTEGQIFIEPQGMCVLAGIGLDRWASRPRARLGPRPARDAARHRPPAAGLHVLPAGAGRDLLLSAGLQGECRHLLPCQPVDHDRGGTPGRRGRGARLLPADQPVGPRGDLARSTAASPTCTRR